MSEKTKVMSTAIKHKGIFDLGELYKAIKEWLDFEGYGDESKTFIEELYVERIKGESKQIEIKWKAEKFAGEYFSNVIKITFYVLGLQDVEIEVDGKKIGTNKLDLTLKISAESVRNRQNKFKNDFIRDLYEKYVIKERINDMEGAIYNKAYGLADEIKRFLELRTA
jgi:hypothetical protein